jgi:hypothetical protein
VKEIELKAYFERESEVPLWFMNGGELMWLEDTLIFLIFSFLLANSWKFRG